MANKQAHQLVTISGSLVADDDLLVLFDTSETASERLKNIKASEIKLYFTEILDELVANKEDKFNKNTAFNKDFGTTSGTVCEGDDGRLSDARTPVAHTHDDRYYTETEINNKFTTIVTGDHGTASSPQVVNVVYGTGTPPAASSVPEGTIWIKYTA